MLGLPFALTSRRYSVLLLVSVISTALCLIAHGVNAGRQTSQPTTQPGYRKAEFIPGEILVRFRRGAAPKKSAGLSVAAGLRNISVEISRLEGQEVVPDLRIAKVAPEDTLTAAAALAHRSDVLYAEPNYIWKSNAVPNDPHFSEMSHLVNTNLPGSPPNDIGAQQAWDTTTGSDSVVIAVIDSGIDIQHTDLKDNIWKNSAEIPDNGIDDDGNGFIDDVNGWDFHNHDKSVFDSPISDAHGTHVAGIIGASGNNGIGVTGVAWRVKLMPVKFLDSADAFGTTADAVAAVQYVKLMHDRGVNVRAVNASWGGPFFSQALGDAVSELNNAGILLVASAGNEGMNTDSFPVYPAGYDLPNVISVGASGFTEPFAPFSNFGERSVDIYTHGIHILSTTPRNFSGADYTDADGSTYSFFDGTSAAAPQVTGVAALMCAAKPNLSIPQLRNGILYGSRILIQNLVTFIHLRADGALGSVLENDVVPPGKINDFRVTSRGGRRVDLAWTASGDDGATGGPAAVWKITFIDQTTGEEIPRAVVRAEAPGYSYLRSINIPFQHTAGKMQIVPIDNVSNEGIASSVDVSVHSIATNAYIPIEGPPEALSTGGTILTGLKGDDKIIGTWLPFSIRLFDQTYGAVSVSTNGVLYFSTPPNDSDALSTRVGLTNQAVIAALWDDLRTDRRPEDGVYMVTPDPDRVIFRWQGVTFDSPLPSGATRGENPVSFEIELQRSGGVVIRYGEGNSKVQPIVGISSGDREPYFITSHSSENGVINLNNAPAIHFNVPPCESFLSPSTENLSGAYSEVKVSVDTGPNCIWTATTDTSWISFSNNSGLGSGILFFYILGNESLVPRTGTITVGSQVLTIHQDGLPCSYQLDAPSQVFASTGGFGTTLITPSFSFCPWTAQSNVPWITLTSGTSGSGGGATNFTVTSNPGAVRTGTIQIAGQLLTVQQWGVASGIDDPATFVHQHYIDFLNREPDADGFAFWIREITSCGTTQQCIDLKRINVSAAFFLSTEFQETGYFAYRSYKTAFGNLPAAPVPIRLDKFLLATQQIGQGVQVGLGDWQTKLQNNKETFALALVQRPEFIVAFANMTADQFVTKLDANAGGVLSATEKSNLIAILGSTPADENKRAQVLRMIADDSGLKNAEFNKAFVLMQYFGYLRRNPNDAPDGDFSGYNFWLNKLNQFGGDFVRADMVKAFIVSGEYRQRFP